ncbi:Zn-ribbon domain-containing OB-fold protein [Candidatus Parvarchaeota archaeon]|nr:Zn-ribbon domain-containing OB-fold protein [Candidatus Parvarchaeota archaeon]
MKAGLALTWRRIPERYMLKGNCCTNCKTNYFPPRKICSKCRRLGKIEPRQFVGRGKIYSFTEVSAPPVGFELEVPYVLALIELEEGPLVTSQIVDCKASDVRIGMPVEMVFRKIQEDGEEGLIHYGYKFRLSRK